MSYTVLAVKWRPRRFDQLVGQEHVVRALANSLAAGRLHHAYLFSGTRGVGKTTLGRILAKALNCESGVVAEPCGVCAACIAIDQGRFVDLIEVDAASRTKVDDTRELLDNVQYAPTQGRFKVYLIDEVHMLSNHSFNALLKTLEEPPPHVKFLLATTDPQKLPVTVLSRCLQFNLKKLTVAQIQAQLEKICADEKVDREPAALTAIARAADGSVRDALSLLDQAIAFGAGELKETQVNAMLGTIDRAHVRRLLEALASLDGSALLREVEQLDAQAPDYGTALDDLMEALQALAVCQLVGTVDADRFDEAEMRELARRIGPEDVQLYYQIAMQGRRDLPVARDARIAFEMTLLRMFAFRPAEDDLDDECAAPRAAGPPAGPPSHGARQSRKSGGTVAGPDEAEPGLAGGAARVRASLEAATGGSTGRRVSRAAGGAGSVAAAQAPAPSDAAAVRQEPDPSGRPGSNQAQDPDPGYDPADDAAFESARESGAPAGGIGPDDTGDGIGEWAELIRSADLRGATRQLAEHCVLLTDAGGCLELMLSEARAALNTEQLRLRLQTWLSEYLGRSLQLRIQVGKPTEPTPAERRAASESERMRRARAAVQRDPNVQALQGAFDAVLEEDSIEPVEPVEPVKVLEPARRKAAPGKRAH